MTEETRTPEEVARARLQDQEAAERQRKLDTFEREERARQHEARRDREAETARTAAQEEAAEIGRRRLEIEETLETKRAEINELLNGLSEVDREHRDALRRGASLGTGPSTPRPLSEAVDQWLFRGFPGYAKARAGGDQNFRPLPVADGLTPDPGGAAVQFSQADKVDDGGLPAMTPEISRQVDEDARRRAAEQREKLEQSSR